VAEGILTEAYYPTIDQPQMGDFQFLVTDGLTRLSEQKRDTLSEVRYHPRKASVEVRGVDRLGWYSFEQRIVTDPSSPVIRIQTVFRPARPGLRIYLLYKPAHQNTGADDQAWATSSALLSEGRPSTISPPFPVRPFTPTATAVVARPGFLRTSAGYVGASDGWQDLQKNFKLSALHPSAGPGNVALVGELNLPELREITTRTPAPLLPLVFEVALGFGNDLVTAEQSARRSLEGRSFDQVRNHYDQGWERWLTSLKPAGRGIWEKSESARLSTLMIKMHEDKTSPGAIIASLSKPGIPDGVKAGEALGGYHLVWPRDLYHAATGLLAAGDTITPLSVIQFLARTQKEDGSWHQNLWTDGSPYWTGLQMDEIAFPILLVEQLVKHGVLRANLLDEATQTLVQKAAHFLMKNGPKTHQDRWEEVGGYVPSTLASEIAALRAASRLLASSPKWDPQWRETAEQWNRQVEEWTLVQSSTLGRNYYLRVSPTGRPNEREVLDLANGAGRALAFSIIDGGFIELVRLGVREAYDTRIQSTLRIYEDSGLLDIASETDALTGARSYRRYNRDFYGPNRVGGYWPLLAGERGHLAIAEGNFERAQAQLALLESQALPSGMIPEQTQSIASPADAGLGVACPLVWAHAEALRLRRSLKDGELFDQPRVD
jgi:glucoamylase